MLSPAIPDTADKILRDLGQDGPILRNWDTVKRKKLNHTNGNPVQAA